MQKVTVWGREMFFQGDSDLINQMPGIAIVGSRNCTALGANIARSIARFFASNGWCIVSGLASGIDTAAHLGALDVNGRTIAVLGTDLEHIYPASNTGLAKRIVSSGGLLLTKYNKPEYDKTQAKKRFTDRDKIIVDLSDAVIPVQAELKLGKIVSGTIVTARYAIQQHKMVCVPCAVPSDLEKYPDRYAGLEQFINQYTGDRYLKTFRGKQDYASLLDLLES
jgi:DNA processing protein